MSRLLLNRFEYVSLCRHCRDWLGGGREALAWFGDYELHRHVGFIATGYVLSLCGGFLFGMMFLG